jgi:single-stranded-DNA-specific exonuclease
LYLRRDEYLERDRFATIGEATQFFTKVVGVTFDGRQDVIGGLTDDSDIELRRDSGNAFDPNAIGVYYGALHLGYLRREIAQRIAPNMDAGANTSRRSVVSPAAARAAWASMCTFGASANGVCAMPP